MERGLRFAAQPVQLRIAAKRETQRQEHTDFSDIRTAAEKEREHFLATVVCLRREPVMLGTTKHQVYDVFDGQQRLTTLVVLLKTIADIS